MSVSTRVTFGLSLPLTARHQCGDVGWLDAAVATGSAALPATEPAQTPPAGLWLRVMAQVSQTAREPSGCLDARPVESGQQWNRLLDRLSEVDGVAVGIEPSGGPPQPTTSPIAVLKT